jgi:hypothetical protein
MVIMLIEVEEAWGIQMHMVVFETWRKRSYHICGWFVNQVLLSWFIQLESEKQLKDWFCSILGHKYASEIANWTLASMKSSI